MNKTSRLLTQNKRKNTGRRGVKNGAKQQVNFPPKKIDNIVDGCDKSHNYVNRDKIYHFKPPFTNLIMLSKNPFFLCKNIFVPARFDKRQKGGKIWASTRDF